MHFTVLHFTELQYTALHCTELQYTVLHCTELYFTLLQFTVLHYTALHCTDYNAFSRIQYHLHLVKVLFRHYTAVSKQIILTVQLLLVNCSEISHILKLKGSQTVGLELVVSLQDDQDLSESAMVMANSPSTVLDNIEVSLVYMKFL